MKGGDQLEDNRRPGNGVWMADVRRRNIREKRVYDHQEWEMNDDDDETSWKTIEDLEMVFGRGYEKEEHQGGESI